MANQFVFPSEKRKPEESHFKVKNGVIEEYKEIQ